MKVSEKFATSRSKPKELAVFLNRASSDAQGVLMTFATNWVSKESTRYLNVSMTKDEAYALGLRLLEISRCTCS